MKNQKKKLKYIPTAIATTDIPSSYEELIIQRRRWNNSSWFGNVLLLEGLKYEVYETSHPWYRKYITIRFLLILKKIYMLNSYIWFSL